MDIPTWATPSTWLRLNLALPVYEDAEIQPPPQAIMQCLSRLMLYRMQEKARKEVEQGEVSKATRHLHYLATHLLSQGERELAQAVLIEADAVTNEKKYSKDGDKRIKYGTRALLLLPGQEGMLS
jgi:Ca-activated chloride channel family protein